MRVVVQFGLSSAQGSQITRQLQLQLNYDCLPQQHAINNSVNWTALPLQSEGQWTLSRIAPVRGQHWQLLLEPNLTWFPAILMSCATPSALARMCVSVFWLFFWWLSFGDFISINTHLNTHTHNSIWVSRSQFGASKEEEAEEEAANKKATWPARSKRFTHFFLARSLSCNSYSLSLTLSISLTF